MAQHGIQHLGIIAVTAIVAWLATTMMRPRGSIMLTPTSVVVQGRFGREQTYALEDVLAVYTFAHVADMLSKDVHERIGWVLTPEGRVFGFVIR